MKDNESAVKQTIICLENIIMEKDEAFITLLNSHEQNIKNLHSAIDAIRKHKPENISAIREVLFLNGILPEKHYFDENGNKRFE
jgi:hypothetical protein